MGGVDLVALNTLGDMHQQQRFRRALVTLNVNMGDRLRQALCEVQKDVRLNGRVQRLTLIINGNIEPALLYAVAEFLTKLPVYKHQTHGIHAQRQHIALTGANLRQTGDKLAVQQAVQRGIFPVLMLTRR
ncbi:Uncharacterised protein [Enterobacter hormaechei]|nr:Uncharacterised protein [Enterobacter hormaechei]